MYKAEHLDTCIQKDTGGVWLYLTAVLSSTVPELNERSGLRLKK